MATLIKIGNSHGIRIPKAVIEQAHLSDKELVFKVIDGGLLIQPVLEPRKNWSQQIDDALKVDEASLVDQEWLNAPLLDDEEWQW
ncbi:MAG: AbrB/MazE/SpoVT family DNA-binding domain-containing protein [Thermodesulfobacteriota bacterium]|nr:AbrB/MazE/SpoVT family DNA-binding domain-containing protein [Thermodesulfobacteriota bacterium]